MNKPLLRRGNLLRVGLDSSVRVHERAASSCEKVSRAKACAHTIPVNNGMAGKLRPSNEHAAIIHALPMTPN